MDYDGNKNYLKPVSLIELPFQCMTWRLTFTGIYNELHIYVNIYIKTPF